MVDVPFESPGRRPVRGNIDLVKKLFPDGRRELTFAKDLLNTLLLPTTAWTDNSLQGRRKAVDAILTRPESFAGLIRALAAVRSEFDIVKWFSDLEKNRIEILAETVRGIVAKQGNLCFIGRRQSKLFAGIKDRLPSIESTVVSVEVGKSASLLNGLAAEPVDRFSNVVLHDVFGDYRGDLDILRAVKRITSAGGNVVVIEKVLPEASSISDSALLGKLLGADIGILRSIFGYLDVVSQACQQVASGVRTSQPFVNPLLAVGEYTQTLSSRGLAPDFVAVTPFEVDVAPLCSGVFQTIVK